MAIISKIGQILNTPINSKRGTNHSTNPFSPTSFKGNVLTADVFDTKPKATSKNKLTYSTFVGSIGDAFPTFRKGIESVIAFGNRMKEGIGTTFRKLQEIGNTEINIDFSGAGKSILNAFDSIYDRYSVNQLKKYDVASLEKIWKETTELNIAG